MRDAKFGVTIAPHVQGDPGVTDDESLADAIEKDGFASVLASMPDVGEGSDLERHQG